MPSHPLKDSVPPPLAARGRAILGLLNEISGAEALELACNAGRWQILQIVTSPAHSSPLLARYLGHSPSRDVMRGAAASLFAFCHSPPA